MRNGIEDFVHGYLYGDYHLPDFIESRLLQNKSEGHCQSCIAILAQEFIKNGREGLLETDKELGEPDRPVEEVLNIFKEKSPENLAAVILGCVIIALDETAWDGYFSFKNFYNRLQDGVRGTQIKFPEVEDLERAEKIEESQLKRMWAAAGRDHSLICFFRESNLMPDSLRRYLFNTLAIIQDPFRARFGNILENFNALAEQIPPKKPAII